MIWAVLLAGVVLVALLQLFVPERALDTLEADRMPEALLGEAEEPVMLEIQIRNDSCRIFPYIAVDTKLPFAREKAVEYSFWLGPRQVLTRRFPVTIDRRGRYVLEDMKLSCGDFLGLREFTKTCGSYREIVIPPKPMTAARLDTLMGGFLGDVSVNRFILEDPVLTLGYREYTSGDPMKRISWTQSARYNRLMVKKNDYTVEPSVSVLLNVDTDLEDNREICETCFRIARSVCSALENNGMRYSFSTNTRLVGYSRGAAGAAGLGQRHFRGILETLGRAIPEADASIQTLLEQELQQPGNCGRILITPGGGETDLGCVARLREFGPLVVIKGTEAALWE